MEKVISWDDISIDLKLSNIWTEFDFFSDICLTSGTNDTKYRMKIIKTFFNDNDEFQGNWQNLFNDIIHIFCFDKRIAGKFIYSKEFRIEQQKLLNERNPLSYGVKKGLFENLSKTIRNNQYFNSPNESYVISDFIYLTPTIKTTPQKVQIIGSSLRNNIDLFHIKTENKSNILITYINNIYESSINLDTNKKVRISKYPEIIHFINSKYYDKFLENLSFNNFQYLVTSFCYNKLTVPSNTNGFLDSFEKSLYLEGLDKCIEYFESANKRYQNIQFTFKMYKHNSFVIVRNGDDIRRTNIMEIQDEWAEKRRAQPLSPRATSKLDTNIK